MFNIPMSIDELHFHIKANRTQIKLFEGLGNLDFEQTNFLFNIKTETMDMVMELEEKMNEVF